MALSNSDNKNYSIKHTPKTTVFSIHLTRFVCLHTVCSDTGTHVNTIYFVVSRGVIFLEFLFWIIRPIDCFDTRKLWQYSVIEQFIYQYVHWYYNYSKFVGGNG